MSNTIAVIDYGMGNLRSVSKALEHVAPDAEVRVTSDPAVVRRAARVVFPGQGAMPDCMREMDARGLRPAVLEAARAKPFLGICIGLQMLFERSEEGDTPGLGVFPGWVKRFPPEAMKDAQVRAIALTRAVGGTIGPVLSVRSGPFQVTTPDSTMTSDIGAYDTSTIEKTVTSTVSVTFKTKK